MNAPSHIAYTAHGVTDAIALLSPGQHIVYHRGSLMFDRKVDNVLGMEARRVDETAKAAWAAYMCGEVELVQRKIAPLKYEYIAIRRDAAKVTGKR
jgi:hypothetical protein